MFIPVAVSPIMYKIPVKLGPIRAGRTTVAFGQRGFYRMREAIENSYTMMSPSESLVRPLRSTVNFFIVKPSFVPLDPN